MGLGGSYWGAAPENLGRRVARADIDVRLGVSEVRTKTTDNGKILRGGSQVASLHGLLLVGGERDCLRERRDVLGDSVDPSHDRMDTGVVVLTDLGGDLGDGGLTSRDVGSEERGQLGVGLVSITIDDERVQSAALNRLDTYRATGDGSEDLDLLAGEVDGETTQLTAGVRGVVARDGVNLAVDEDQLDTHATESAPESVGESEAGGGEVMMDGGEDGATLDSGMVGADVGRLGVEDRADLTLIASILDEEAGDSLRNLRDLVAGGVRDVRDERKLVGDQVGQDVLSELIYHRLVVMGVLVATNTEPIREGGKRRKSRLEGVSEVGDGVVRRLRSALRSGLDTPGRGARALGRELEEGDGGSGGSGSSSGVSSELSSDSSAGSSRSVDGGHGSRLGKRLVLGWELFSFK